MGAVSHNPIASPPCVPVLLPQIAWLKNTGAGQALWHIFSQPGALPIVDGWSTDEEGNLVKPTWRSQARAAARFHLPCACFLAPRAHALGANSAPLMCAAAFSVSSSNAAGFSDG